MKLPRIGKKHFLLYVSIAAALSVVSVTFAWFAANRLVRSNNLGMAAYGSQVEVQYAVVTNGTAGGFVVMNPSTTVSLTNGIRYPGDYQEYKFKITNIGDEPVNIASFGISAPTTDEEKANNAGYSFGTQIQVQLLNVENGTLPENATARYLSKYADPAAKTLEDAADIPLWNGIIPAKKDDSAEEKDYSVVLTVRFTFENKNVPQNEYISFGKNGDGVCQRRFYIQFDLEPDSSAPQS